MLRIVPRGAIAEQWDEECERRAEEFGWTMDSPSDLVLLEVEVVNDARGKEREIDRKEFVSGHAASEYLVQGLRRAQEAAR